MEIEDKHIRLGWVAAALILSLSVAYYLVVFLPEERRQANARAQSEDLFKRQIECREQFMKLERQFNNILGVEYSPLLNTCLVRYTDSNGQQQTTLLNDFGKLPPNR